MSQVTLSNQSTWASKLKAMGPGILMASAAVGGSHSRILYSSWWFLWVVTTPLGYLGQCF